MLIMPFLWWLRERYYSKTRKAISGEATCYYCEHPWGTKISTKNGVVPLRKTVDHIVPLVVGGCNDPRNVVAACQLCNMAKAQSIYLNRDIARRALMKVWIDQGWTVLEDERKEAHEQD